MASEYSQELEFALELAVTGGRIALESYGGSPERRKKDDGSWVTEADLRTEAEIRKLIAETWPGHNVLGEEQGLTSASGGAPENDAPTWIVDPIDGTNNFVWGVPIWATLVALSLNGDFVVGAVHAPALEETYDAAAGLGARFNGEPIEVDRVDSLASATIVHGGEHGFFDTPFEDFYAGLVRDCWRVRGFGDFWGHMLVARGAAHVMMEPAVSLWDVAALVPIVSEAGGTFSHLDGAPWRDGVGNALSTNGVLHEQITQRVRDSLGKGR
jgi:histidinol-phosphatase